MDYDGFREFLAGISKWAITDSPSSPTKEASPMKQNGGYFGSLRNRSASMSPWGDGPEPADHDFMQRLFRSWRRKDVAELTLQDVVAGLARIKGPSDIMSNIAYFFELYDDDHDEKVDREGILSISEGLLFLSRRGINTGSSRASESGPPDFAPDGTPIRRDNKDEQFLGAVSAFIRRCFEYADPGQTQQGSDERAEDGDLLDLSDKVASTDINEQDPAAQRSNSRSQLSFGQTYSNKHASANAALDPDHPLHLTLPTFRMLVLADESLETFFDSGLPNSFHLADAPLPSSTISSTSNLTTFASVGIPTHQNGTRPLLSPGGPGAGVVAPGKGLRGMLDNIVTDGMKVAAEVRRRMDEGAVTRGIDDDEEEEEGEEGAKDLLEGADAEAGGSGLSGRDGPGLLDEALHVDTEGLKVDKGKGKEPTSAASEDIEKSTVFER